MPPKQISSLETDKKRCRKSVTLETKLEVLRRIEAGEKVVKISKAMGLAKSTIQTIRDKKETIKTYLQSAAPLNVSRLTRQRSWIMEKMEKQLISWINDNNIQRIPMSQMAIQEKALSIFENLKNGDSNESAEDVTFQASRGWFEKFKNRFDLHNLKMKGEVANTNEVTARKYPNILKGKNAVGDIKLQPLLIYVSENPKPLKRLNQNRLPLKAWMTKGLNKRDMLDLLEADREPLSYEELIQLQAESTLDEETEPVVSKQLTSKNLSKALSYFEQGINILLENDPDFERSAKVSRGITSAIKCYKLLKNEMDKKAGQTTLDNFFKPVPSLKAKVDYDSYLDITISSSSSD